jgi:hypothetical protein
MLIIIRSDIFRVPEIDEELLCCYCDYVGDYALKGDLFYRTAAAAAAVVEARGERIEGEVAVLPFVK